MKYGVYIIVISAMLTACNSGSHEQALTQSAIDAKVDSIVGMKMEDLNRQSMEDLDRRISIEVKVKADSIVEAYKAGLVADTAVKP